MHTCTVPVDELTADLKLRTSFKTVTCDVPALVSFFTSLKSRHLAYIASPGQLQLAVSNATVGWSAWG